jgi:hypothetical protein
MVDFGDAGRICLNREISGACENCLWWEWDSTRRQCCNCQYHICPLYRERLFNTAYQNRAHRTYRTPEETRPANAGSDDPPASRAGESGTS